jgi:hypothetical protein
MRRRVLKFNSYLVLLVSVIGIQFLLLPFYHFHPDHQHSHSGGLPSHQHNAYFHSIELDSIAHLTYGHDHNSVDHHSKNNDDETELKIDLNKVTLKSKNSFKVLKVFSTFLPLDTLQKIDIYDLPTKLNDFSHLAFKHQLRERSPPYSFV